MTRHHNTGRAIFGSQQYGEGDLHSRYTVDFAKYETTYNRRRLTPQTHESGAKFEARSTNQEYYGPPPTDRARTQPVPLPASAFLPSDQPLDSLTSYASNFTGQTQSRTKSMAPPKNCVVTTGTLETATTSGSTYQPWNVRPREPYRLTSDLGDKLGRDDNPTYQTESASKFNDKGFIVRASLKPPREDLKDLGKFEGISVAQADYVDWKKPPREILKPENSRKAVSETRDFITEKARQYGDKPYQAPAKLMRPLRDSNRGGSEFYDETTSGSTFVPFDGARPAVPSKTAARGSAVKQGDHPFQGNTSYSNQFTGQTQAPTASMKPLNAPVQTGVFEASTTYRQTHMPFDARPADPFLPRPEGWYKPDSNANKISYQTEQGSAFNDKGLVARRTMKPPPSKYGVY